MKKTVVLLQEENSEVMERYELCIGRIKEITKEGTVKEPYLNYFRKTAELLLFIDQIANEVKSGNLYKKSLEELQEQNQKLYEDILPNQYETSYANPTYAVSSLGEKYGKLLMLLLTEIRSLIPCAFEHKLFEITIAAELFISIYNCFEDENETTYKEVKEMIYYYAHDYCTDFYLRKAREDIDPTYTFARDIIMDSDLNDLRYLYFFGEYITENELKIAKFLNDMSEDEVRAMAKTYTDGYCRGFDTMGADLSIKSIVSIKYCIGFERMMKYAVETFEKMGKKVTFGRSLNNVINRSSASRKFGYHAVSANLQFEYDHRFDKGCFLDKKIKDVMFAAQKAAYEKYKIEYSQYAGPAVLEAFGDPYNAPYLKEEAFGYDRQQQKLITELSSAVNALSANYIKDEETSYTIIAYPLPSIGDDFDAIFAETVKLNNLDNDVYKKIQQAIIDELDTGEYCKVLGFGENKTDLKIMLHELKDPSKETNFENCTADVNIPVGEVFTSPVLKGTNGTLHVGEIFLNGLAFKDLYLTFEDGMITSYTCSNFAKQEENEKFMRENLLRNHDTLPLGEFAIGTNTVAYVMARKYNIGEKLPILIAEKTGPHFAVGDTCYSMSEDHKLYNPDGKEIIAKENECSALRHTDMSKAYFSTHTDITIPYNEISEISVYRKNGSKSDIIKDGRFVLPGTEELNKAFEEK